MEVLTDLDVQALHESPPNSIPSQPKSLAFGNRLLDLSSRAVDPWDSADFIAANSRIHLCFTDTVIDLRQNMRFPGSQGGVDGHTPSLMPNFR